VSVSDSDDNIYEDDSQTLTIFPPGTVFFEPDGINQVTIQFPDENSAIVFFEWCRELVKRSEGRKGQ